MATRNRYQEIMAQYQQAQPFSFTGYPSSYGNQSDYSGGYDNTPYVEPVEQAPYVGLIDDQYTGVSGGGGGGGGGANREGPSAFSQMTPAERAAYYRERPIEGNLALGAQDVFGNVSLMGQSAKYFGNDGWYDSRLEKMGVNPTISVDTQNALAGEAMQRALDSQSQSQGGGAYGGGGGYSGAPSAGSDVGRSAPGSAHYAQGGHVSMMHLLGPDPEGPDDGYATLKDGEFVINDKAVKKYGIELMQAINSGKISKGKLRGLLEM